MQYYHTAIAIAPTLRLAAKGGRQGVEVVVVLTRVLFVRLSLSFCLFSTFAD